MNARSEDSVIRIADPSLVMLVGAAGAGKSTFAAKHFAPSEVLASEHMRELVSGDAHALDANADAFNALFTIARIRLRRRMLTVVDATSVNRGDQDALRALATECHAKLEAIVFDIDHDVAQTRNRERARSEPAHIVRRQHARMRGSRKHVRRLTRGATHVIDSDNALDGVRVERIALECDRRSLSGPFDIIGDVHGCLEELIALLAKLGYTVTQSEGRWRLTHGDGRMPVFVGDLIDRGPENLACLALACDTADDGTAVVVEGNHETRLARVMRRRRESPSASHGLAETLAEVERLDDEQRGALMRRLTTLPSHAVLAGGALVVAHAGLDAAMHLGVGGAVRAFARYGKTTGESDAFGLPVRERWADEYRGDADVVYGHTPTAQAHWAGATLCIDTGCVFGGALSALRWPEREIVAVPALREYYAPVAPLSDDAQARTAELTLDDVVGTRRIATRGMRSIRIDAARAATALEAASRFALSPNWLVYIPPTMAPCEASRDDDTKWLEHPRNAFEEYARTGVRHVVCELKHMGSRAIAIVGRKADSIESAFGVAGEGRVYTRTGRRFFNENDEERALLATVRRSMDRAGLWDALGTEWIMLDGEIVPWVVKGAGLINTHYRAPGVAGAIALAHASTTLDAYRARTGETPDGAALAERTAERNQAIGRFNAIIERYGSMTGHAAYAPFTILAGAGAAHADTETRSWQRERLDQLVTASSGMLVHTPSMRVATASTEEREEATTWWRTLVEGTEEGLVVKPDDGVYGAEHMRRRVQPALKVRGREYLRIIYGPEYTIAGHMARVRKRATGAKRSLALREHAIGCEGLTRLVARRALHERYECALAVLALESEPTDPRL